MIDFKDVSKVYENGSVALSHVSLHIGKGEFVFVVGASGAGKSTFIKMLSHEELPSQGSVFVDGIEVNKLPKSRVPYLRRKMGIVFQDFRLLPNKTAAENVAFAIGVKLLVLTLGALGCASIWAAVFADVGVSVLAILNAVRTLFYKPDHQKNPA